MYSEDVLSGEFTIKRVFDFRWRREVRRAVSAEEGAGAGAGERVRVHRTLAR